MTYIKGGNVCLSFVTGQQTGASVRSLRIVVVGWHFSAGSTSFRYSARLMTTTYPCSFIVADDNRRVPLRGALGPVHFNPVAHQNAGGGEEDALAVLLFGPTSDGRPQFGVVTHPRQSGVPFLQQKGLLMDGRFII